MLRSRQFAVLLLALAFVAFATNAEAQRRYKKAAAVPIDSAQSEPTLATPQPMEIKPDRLIIRYKPQAGTLLYNVRTEIAQHVRTDRDELTGALVSSAQLAFHNVSIDYKKDTWVFDRYFTHFEINGRNLSGDTLKLNENQAVNRITRLTYEMR